MKKIHQVVNLLTNMGPRYVAYRSWHEFTRRTGLLKNRFPVDPPKKDFCSLIDWKKSKVAFFFDNRTSLNIRKSRESELEVRFTELINGQFRLFNNILVSLGNNYDWITNPENGYKYDNNKHWSEIADLSASAGDIKYVWEKSRFSYLYDVIRYDYHFDKDHSAFIWSEIESWIDNNPVNCGPNYRCSQEMSLRVLNWIFALKFYSDAPTLTEELFQKLTHTIYWHLHHIYANINFSRIAVRNNHAITETLTLYIGGLFFPWFPDSGLWKKNGKKWFEEEIVYQIYEDGTYLQFSMNYHRVVVQLLTWGITLAHLNNDKFSPKVYERARKSVLFLRTCMPEDSNGKLPNYGANDGALFFKLNDNEYRDYRPQIQALAYALGISSGLKQEYEDAFWYGNRAINEEWLPSDGIHCFDNGGYYVLRDKETLTFVRCGEYKDRPSQADGLHIDIWHKGRNIFCDAGSYKYNTDNETIKYFNGTKSHNTLMLDKYDQMQKGGRFIWYYWTEKVNVFVTETENSYCFTGSIKCYKQVSPNIVHTRTINKIKGKAEWTVTDEIKGAPKHLIRIQLWHMPKNEIATIKVTDEHNNTINMSETEGYASSMYGTKEITREITATTHTNLIETIIVL